MRNTLHIFLALAALAVAAISCKKLMPGGPPENEVLAGTIPGLSPTQEKAHLDGDAAFGQIFTPGDGLGPIFLQNACGNCHNGNGKGHPSNVLTRFAFVSGSNVDYLLGQGGPQLQEHSIPGYLAETMPEKANVFSRRMAPAVMGLGFIAALSDQAILANEDPNDLNLDGISGRAAWVNPSPFFQPMPIHQNNGGKFLGRFGKKAEKVTILDQVVFALKQDMGITSTFDPMEIFNHAVGPNTGDLVPEPEVSSAFVNSLVFYMSTLKAPDRRNADDPEVLAGEQIFKNIGCTSCHAPQFTTAQSPIAALSNKTFHPYSDFLLHDMGATLDDGFPEGAAQSTEWRTPPLWGIGLASASQGGQMFLLHDGRASSFEAALSFHGGEATSRRMAFFNLSLADQQRVIKFLESL